MVWYLKGRVNSALPFLLLGSEFFSYWVPNGEVNENVWGRRSRGTPTKGAVSLR